MHHVLPEARDQPEHDLLDEGLLQRGDVVLFDFPTSTDDPDRSAGPRPCLVLEAEKRHGGIFVELAPGESHPPVIARGYEIAVARYPALRAAGLDEAHLFRADLRLTVAVAHPAFGNRTSPRVLGHLMGAELARMHAVRARIHAWRDIAIDTLRRRREDRQSDRGVSLPRRSDHQLPARTAGKANMEGTSA
jgi:hypothetical protein